MESVIWWDPITSIDYHLDEEDEPIVRDNQIYLPSQYEAAAQTVLRCMNGADAQTALAEIRRRYALGGGDAASEPV